MLTAFARVFLCHTAVFLLACLLSSQLLAQSPSVGGPNTFRFSDSLVSRPFLSSQEGEGGGAEGSEEANESEREFEEEEDEEEEELETDRDSFTPATSTVARGRLLVESAYSFIDNRRVAETHSYPELLLRYGWSDIVELRFGANYEIGGAGNPISGNVSDFEEEEKELEEESKILYGAKFFLSKQRGWTPKSSFILQGFTPTYGVSNLTTMSATQVFGWQLRNGWVWDNAFRFATSGFEDDHFNVWSPSTVVKIPLTERLKVHAEYFGAMTAGREQETTQHFFSPGAHYLLTRNFEVGSRFGWGLNEQSPNFFLNVGIGWLY
jgi:hypothetical protein